MIYIHVPFCRSFCTYCGFYSEICSGDDGMVLEYRDALLREIGGRAHQFERTSDTLYIGGGTPSVLPPSVLSSIVLALGPSQYEEFTVEVNPDDVDIGYARFLKSLGANRVSMGVQSFDDGVLRWMNRRHDSASAVKAFDCLRKAGFDNISIDLISGISGMDASIWEKSLEKAVELAPEHISSYQLSVEDGSALQDLVASGRYEPADDELCAREYAMLCGTLGEAGYEHYEISNFALPGREAVHNGGYWKHIPYVGLGPAAHSLSIKDGRYTRSWNVSDIRSYVDGMKGGEETLSDEEVLEERIMLGLRTSGGIERDLLDDSLVRRYLSSGCLEVNGMGRLRIPERKFFVSDDIIAEIVSAISIQ